MRRSAALVLALLFGSTAAARAEDFGPPRDVAAVRYDAARLIARAVRYDKRDPAQTTFSDTVVDGDWALTSWKNQTLKGIIVVNRRRGQWWDVLEGIASQTFGWRFDAGPSLKAAWNVYYDGPENKLLAQMHVPAQLIALASAHNADVAGAKGSYTGHGDPYCGDFCRWLKPGGGTIETVDRAESAGYSLKIALSANSSTSADSIKRVFVRMPTDGESTQTLHGDAFVFFTVELAGQAPVTFKPGTTVDMWFPHVLDAYRHYGLTAAMADSAFGPVRGTLADNTLHFVLPAFTVTPADPVMFEIDGDP